MLNVFDTSDGKERSLNDCCDWLADEFDLRMTKQSLDERYNIDSMSFKIPANLSTFYIGYQNGGKAIIKMHTFEEERPRQKFVLLCKEFPRK